MVARHNEFCPVTFPPGSFKTDASDDVGGFELLRLALPAASTVLELRRPVHGVALGGKLPPGTYARVTPWEQRAFLALTDNPNVLIMRPGDALAARFPQGIAAMVVSPYAHAAPMGMTPSSPWYAETPEALLYCFLDTSQVCNVGFCKVPGHAEIPAPDVPTTAPVQTEVTTLDVGALAVPAGATSVLVHLRKINGTDDRIRLDGNYEAEVWWLTEARFWAHSEADDFDAAGLGIANAAHDSELYAVSQGVRAVYVRTIAYVLSGYPAWHAVFGW